MKDRGAGRVQTHDRQADGVGEEQTKGGSRGQLMNW